MLYIIYKKKEYANMNKLTSIVSVIHNDMDCVVLKIANNKRMELIFTGCFDGDETMIRMTKELPHIYTIFKGDKYYSTAFEKNVEYKVKKMIELIRETVVEDFGINVSGDKEFIISTCGDATIEKARSGKHEIVISRSYDDSVAIYRDHSFVKTVPNETIARKWVFEHYDNICSENQDDLYHHKRIVFITE